MFEHRTHRLIPWQAYAKRQAVFIGVAAIFMGAVLALGTLGYHTAEPLSWVDSFYSASMILSGMGPPVELHSEGAKIFASLYALLCGVVLLTSVSVAIAPAYHRIMHRLHVERGKE